MGLLYPATIIQVAAAEFIPMGSLPDFPQFTRPRDISAAGDVVVGDHGFIWRDGQGMTTLPGLEDASFKGISHDGGTIVGSMPNRLGFVYSDTDGLDLLPNVVLLDVSGDGTVAVGTIPTDDVSGNVEAVRWTVESGIEQLGFLGAEPDGDLRSQALGISDDGMTIVGVSTHPGGDSGVFWKNGVISPVGEFEEADSQTRVVSGDGTVFAGWIREAEGEGVQAVYWSEAERTSLGTLDGFWETVVRGISTDGTTVVGFGRTDTTLVPFIWTPETGMEGLQDVLATRYGLADALSGWQLLSATAMSPSGQFIAGRGINPAGVSEAYLVRLETVPEPSSMALLGIALAGVMLVARKRAST